MRTASFSFVVIVSAGFGLLPGAADLAGGASLDFALISSLALENFNSSKTYESVLLLFRG